MNPRIKKALIFFVLAVFIVVSVIKMVDDSISNLKEPLENKISQTVSDLLKINCVARIQRLELSMFNSTIIGGLKLQYNGRDLVISKLNIDFNPISLLVRQTSKLSGAILAGGVKHDLTGSLNLAKFGDFSTFILKDANLKMNKVSAAPLLRLAIAEPSFLGINPSTIKGNVSGSINLKTEDSQVTIDSDLIFTDVNFTAFIENKSRNFRFSSILSRVKYDNKLKTLQPTVFNFGANKRFLLEINGWEEWTLSQRGAPQEWVAIAVGMGCPRSTLDKMMTRENSKLKFRRQNSASVLCQLI